MPGARNSGRGPLSMVARQKGTRWNPTVPAGPSGPARGIPRPPFRTPLIALPAPIGSSLFAGGGGLGPDHRPAQDRTGARSTITAAVVHSRGLAEERRLPRLGGLGSARIQEQIALRILRERVLEGLLASPGMISPRHLHADPFWGPIKTDPRFPPPCPEWRSGSWTVTGGPLFQLFP
jgi:hypothetical protein